MQIVKKDNPKKWCKNTLFVIKIAVTFVPIMRLRYIFILFSDGRLKLKLSERNLQLIEKGQTQKHTNTHAQGNY